MFTGILLDCRLFDKGGLKLTLNCPRDESKERIEAVRDVDRKTGQNPWKVDLEFLATALYVDYLIVLRLSYIVKEQWPNRRWLRLSIVFG